MTDYLTLRVNCNPCSEDITDLLADALSEVGFDSFVADDSGLEAYIRRDIYDAIATQEILNDFDMPVEFETSETIVEGKDWNEEWEKNYFKPIRIADKCLVRSSFHPSEKVDYEIIIDPRMAFGTGHHATTSQMISYLLDYPSEQKTVIDMGTGTGILAILASKMGGFPVFGIEIDPDAAINARENCELNGVSPDILTGDSSQLAPLPQADILLANINRNVILADLSRYASKIKPGGMAFFSGFYNEDIPLVEKAASLHGLTLCETRLQDNWAALRFVKHSHV